MVMILFTHQMWINHQVKTFARQCVRIPVSARHVGSMEKRAALLRAVKSRKPGTCYWLWHTTWKDCLNSLSTTEWLRKHWDIALSGPEIAGWV